MFTLPGLPYEYNALEPYIDEGTMRIHHTKHHQTYIDKLNTALENHPDLQAKTIEDLVKDIDKLPQEIQTSVRNNGGGHLNHSVFWKLMAPGQPGEPSGKIAQSIDSVFGNFSNFQIKFAEAAVNRFGSGWVWLVDNKGNLEITSTPNQDNPISSGQKPVLALDVWEHAYYLKYQNRRPEYIDAWWNVVNWQEVEKRLLKK